MSKTAIDASFIPLRVAVITISDSRTAENDSSGDFLVDGLESEGHVLALEKSSGTTATCCARKYRL